MHVLHCRLCKSENLLKFLDLGEHPPSDAFLTKDELAEEEPRYPLDVYLCQNCGQVQLGYVVPPDLLFCKSYPYESSTTRTGREHFFQMAKEIVERFGLKSDALAIDMGSNVGVLLLGFQAQGVRVLGVDPARIMAEAANSKGIRTIADFFSARLAEEILRKYGQAAVITGTNVFAHIHDLDDIIQGVKTLLADDGVFIVESPHFLDLVHQNEYDTIYHEHLSYLSIKPLAEFFRAHGLELFDVQKTNIHGGSIRIFVGQPGRHPVSQNVTEIIRQEEEAQIHIPARLARFAQEVAEQKRLLIELLQDLKSQGKRVVGVSAPAKGNTLLNYCGITTEHLDYITEKADMKVGLYAPGTRIPIYADSRLIEDQPDYALILAWNFAEEIMHNLSEYQRRGGKFIIPIPKPRIVE